MDRVRSQPDSASGGVGLEKKDRKGEGHIIFPLKAREEQEPKPKHANGNFFDHGLRMLFSESFTSTSFVCTNLKPQQSRKRRENVATSRL